MRNEYSTYTCPDTSLSEGVSDALHTLYDYNPPSQYSNPLNDCHGCCETISTLKYRIERLEQELEKIKSRVSFEKTLPSCVQCCTLRAAK
jgi:hypothetical protein